MLSTYMSVCCGYTVYISALADLRGGGKGAMPPKMPEVTRSPCQPKILVCSSTQNVQFKVELTGSGNRSLSSSYFFSFDIVF